MSYRVTVNGPGLTIDKDVEEAAVLRVLSVLLGPPASGIAPLANLRSGASTLQASEGTADITPRPGESMREYIDRLRGRSNAAKIVAIGLHTRGVRGSSTFSNRDIRDGFVAAAESLPGNLSRDVKLTAQMGWIARSPGEDDSWYVTARGEAAAVRGFLNAVPARRTRSRSQKSAASSDDGADQAGGRSGRAKEGASRALAELLAEGYFGTPRVTQDILSALQERGREFNRTDLTQPLLTLVRTRPPKLKRAKVSQKGSTRPVWAYSEG